MATILIAEDNTMIGMMMQLDLEDAGHHVLGPAADNQQALALIARAGGTPDLALVDIDLKDGDSGVTLAGVLTGRHDVACLFVSGQLAAATRNQSLALGVLTKPFQTEDLTAAVTGALAYAGGGERPAPGHPVVWF